ncbi:glutathione peroxidase [Litoribrevibacter albus]|uniref:Glutathione peroxidase n=1 Tax=Litoribrevibacter albus TaxID=1473156 RepID=A0AA37S832_9GAMM|nr:glutathione peroxidase [Litoribrevibacter albus]GLQ30110.1 glutathione peroxidase [Litoribrevibacter albus]
MSVYQFTANTLTGEEVSLEKYQGKVLLIVNTASKCGLTPQYEGLEALYKEMEGKGVEILGFPCNQFGNQEPGSSEEIASFCLKNYGVSFPMFEKVDVNGSDAHPLYKYLKSNAKGLLGSETIKWNFTKFLINKDGEVVSRYAPTTPPEKIKADIEKML